MTPDVFAAIVADAALSPNVHNIQPTLWRRLDDGIVAVVQAPGRTLPVGDPSGRDLAASHGAAVEGFVLAASARGLAMTVTPGEPGEIVRLKAAGQTTHDPLAASLPRRRTYRGKFARASKPEVLDILANAAPDLTLLRQPAEIDVIARLNDQASLRTFRDRAFRAELVSWMRFSSRDPRWPEDGLNARAMEMSGFEAMAASVVLRPGVFEALDRFGLAAAMVGEADVVRSSAAIALFHRPADEPPFETGRRWHRVWLEMTRLGLSAAPMTVLADDDAASATVAERFGCPAGARLITAFRLGVAPNGALPPAARRPLDQTIV